MYVEVDSQDEEGALENEVKEAEEEDEEEEASPIKKATKKSGRPSKIDLLMAELEEAKAAREQDRLARVALEKQLQELQSRPVTQAAKSVATFTTPAPAPATQQVYAASVSSGSGVVTQRYMELRDMHEELSLADELARVKKDNMLMRKAMNGY